MLTQAEIEDALSELESLKSIRYWMHNILDRYNGSEDERKIEEQHASKTNQEITLFTDAFKAKLYHAFLEEIDDLWFNK
jgi:hypothetical protein